MTFKELGLMEPILKALAEQGYTDPTPIQRGAIPPALIGRDVLGCAQTGTGKTCAFAAPILQRLNGRNGNPRKIHALVLTPTRELAIQIQECVADYGRHLSLRSAVIFGGVGQGPQVEKLKKGIDVLVATPGRLLDLHGQNLLDLSQVEIFVLDEADRMLDMGFIHDVRRVLKLLPEKKQTLFFSATMPPEVMDLVNSLLHDYARVAVDPVSSPVEVIDQSLYYVNKGNKTKLLAWLLEEKNISSALVFSRTKHGANRIAQDLNKKGLTAAAIHGNKSQTARQQALADFKEGKLRALVATDIAARGLDIEALGYVFNYNLPDVPETYVHRIGRTGRAGRDGVAITFCEPGERDDLKAVEKLIGKKIPVVEGHPFPLTEEEPAAEPEARPAGQGRGRSPRRPAGEQKSGEKRPAAQAKTPVIPTAKPQPAPKAQPVAGSEDAANADEGRRRRRRGTRQGDLSATQPAAPVTASGDFVKPDPLGGDVIMDATARLLAPRHPVQTAAKPGSAQQPAQRPDSGKSRGGNGRNGSRRAEKAPQEGKAKEKVEQRQAQNPKGQAPIPAKKKRRRDHDRPFPQERSHYAGTQKDSTEQQESVIRPYYLNQD